MISNIDKIYLIQHIVYKRKFRVNIILLLISTFLFGCNNSSFFYPKSTTKNKAFLSGRRPACYSVNKDKHSFKPILGPVSHLKVDGCFGFVAYDLPHQSVVDESKKMGLIFYAPKPLTHYAAVHFSNQQVVLTSYEGSQKSAIVEINGKLFDDLLKEVVPLANGNERLEATCDSDFTIFSAKAYGIKEHDGSASSITLLEGDLADLDKDRFKDINHAGFILIGSTTLYTNKLIELVKALSNNTIQSVSQIHSASFYGNSLRPAENSLDGPAYGYIKKGNRYRLMLLNNSRSFSTSNLFNNSDCVKSSMPVLSESKPIQLPQEVIAVTDHSKTFNQSAATRSNLPVMIHSFDVSPGLNVAEAQSMFDSAYSSESEEVDINCDPDTIALQSQSDDPDFNDRNCDGEKSALDAFDLDDTNSDGPELEWYGLDLDNTNSGGSELERDDSGCDAIDRDDEELIDFIEASASSMFSESDSNNLPVNQSQDIFECVSPDVEQNDMPNQELLDKCKKPCQLDIYKLSCMEDEDIYDEEEDQYIYDNF